MFSALINHGKHRGEEHRGERAAVAVSSYAPPT